MKSLFQLIAIGFLIISCKSENKPRNIENFSIEIFKMDSTSIRTIVAVDENTLYFAGSKGEIGFTKDGGKSWEKEFMIYKDSVIPHFRSLATNGTDFFALSIGNPALLYKKSKEKTELVYAEENDAVFYDSMQFFDAKNGIAIGDPTDGCMSILKTSDGGNTWIKIPCNKIPQAFEGEAAFAASNTNIKIIDNTIWFASGGMKSRIYKSEDFGETWRVYETPVIQGEEAKGIYSIDFADKNFGIAIGGDYSKPMLNLGNKAMTTDGGITWTLFGDNQNPNYKSCVQFVPNLDGQEIFAVGKTGISISKDAGKTWKDISKEAYYAIDFVDENSAWLSGNEKIGKLVFN